MATDLKPSVQQHSGHAGEQPPHPFSQAGGSQIGSRNGSLAPGASMDLALLNLASSASADLRFRRAESLLPCGLTQDELNELLGRFASAHGGGSLAAPKSDGGRAEGGSEGHHRGEAPGAAIGGGVRVTAGGPAGGGAEGHKGGYVG